MKEQQKSGREMTALAAQHTIWFYPLLTLFIRDYFYLVLVLFVRISNFSTNSTL